MERGKKRDGYYPTYYGGSTKQNSRVIFYTSHSNVGIPFRRNSDPWRAILNVLIAILIGGVKVFDHNGGVVDNPA